MQHLATKLHLKIINNKYSLSIFIIFLLFFIIRLFSFYTQTNNILESLFGLLLITIFLYIYNKNKKLAFILFFSEILLGGSGHSIEIFSISLRTSLLLSVLTSYFIANIKNLKKIILKNKNLSYLFSAIMFSFLIAIYNKHTFNFIYQDAIPFLYILLYLPLTSSQVNIKSLFTKLKPVIFGALSAHLVYSFITLLLFSNNIFFLQNSYYKWFRDFEMGKITDMGTGFFRIVLPEHLLLVLAVIFFTPVIKCSYKKLINYLPYITSIAILAINFGRTYLLGILFGTLALINKNTRKYLSSLVILVLLYISSFSSIHLISSNFQNTGLELLGLRTSTIIKPTSEYSTHTRTTLLQPIVKNINNNLLLGNGLGSVITFKEINTQKQITTRQYDWGYLELLSEFGLIIFIFILYNLFLLAKKAYNLKNKKYFASIVALLVMNITAPILLHPLGILSLVLIWVGVEQEK